MESDTYAAALTATLTFKVRVALILGSLETPIDIVSPAFYPYQ